MKTEVLKWIDELGHTVFDLGCKDESAVDYPDFAHAVAEAVTHGRCDLGVAFNAGLWCYESWAPTVRVATTGAAPLLVTAELDTFAAAAALATAGALAASSALAAAAAAFGVHHLIF